MEDLKSKSDIELVVFRASLWTRGQCLGMGAIVDHVSSALVAGHDNAVSSGGVRALCRPITMETLRLLWLKTVCQCLVGSWPSFLGEKSYELIVIADVGPIQWYEQSVMKQGRGNWSWVITMGDFLKIAGVCLGLDRYINYYQDKNNKVSWKIASFKENEIVLKTKLKWFWHNKIVHINCSNHAFISNRLIREEIHFSHMYSKGHIMYLPRNKNENVSRVPSGGLEQKGARVPHHLPRGTWKQFPAREESHTS